MKDRILELLKNKKMNELHSYLHKQNSKVLSNVFEELSIENRIIVFRLLTKEKGAEIFSHMDSDMQESLITSLTDKELKEVINELFTDDTVDLIEEMPANVVKRILKNINTKDRKIINEFLNYPEDSAGSIMTNEFVDLKETLTVEESFDRIRKTGVDKETIYTCYVLSESRKLLGLVSVRELLLSDKKTQIKDIMKTSLIFANTIEDQESVAKKMQEYDFLALPVVDKENRLVGIVTIDDAVDVLQEENTEDFQKMAAITPVEDEYFKTSVFSHVIHRLFWLIVLMISAIITGNIITEYENAFAAIPLLVAFIPMIMGTGGNCGSQASTLIIRGLAMDEIKTSDIFKVMFKEARIAIIIGISLAIINGIRVVIQYKDITLAIVVGISLIFTVLLAKLLGCVLPIIAKKIKLDPAIMAAPIIATIVDTCSVLIYFKIALLIMKI